jgi:ABC-type Fe3+/spermidine/putrescine transport system ATPase subunit
MVASDAQRNDDPNSVPGTIIEVIYLGRFIKYTVDVEGLNISVVQQIESHNRVIYVSSERIFLNWDPESATILPSP